MPEFNPGDRVVYVHNRQDGDCHEAGSSSYRPAGITGTYIGTSNANHNISNISEVHWDDAQYNVRASGSREPYCVVWKDNLEPDMSDQLIDIVSEVLLDAACGLWKETTNEN